MSQLVIKCERVLEHFRQNEHLSDAAYRELIESLRRSSARDAGRVLGRELAEAGIRPHTIAEILAESLGLPRFSPTTQVAAQGVDWAVGTDGVCYMTNPLDVTAYQELLRNPKLNIQKQGVLGYHQLDLINESGNKQTMVEARVGEGADQLMRRIVDLAIQHRASDIHLEPVADRADIRLRVDGLVQKYGQIELNTDYLPLANYILEESGEQAGEYLRPRDGQFSWSLRHREINVRMSMVPGKVGSGIAPRFALRLLGLEMDLVDLDEIGLSSHPDNDQMAAIKRVLSQTSGLVIVSGPTGSGKTTTLNAGLRWMTRTMPTKTFFAAEDPVEIENPTVTQVEINERAGVTFESALRAFLRQDPDVVMIGEMRDKNSMSLGIRASNTGHLVLTSLHTKTALGCVPRLLDMGAEADQLSEAIAGVMAQRTVRRVCQHCSETVSLSDYLELKHPFLRDLRGIFRETIAEIPNRYSDLFFYPQADAAIRVANRVGCERCRGGYRGRTVIAEFLTIDETLSEMISDGATRAQLERHAVTQGFRPMWEHGMQLVGEGITTFAEIERTLGQRQPTIKPIRDASRVPQLARDEAVVG
ncbi:Flp pilus assembly complex ATPase component TadA [Endozoicomonas sp. G2_2]|uniref:ATPase, T2SS/T4P/T4SS family n=1 Tax=Endozoicomonas sp. G2_2 TaxID=2821092 RepID=UPI001ADB64B7|nr:ATPase, T2SS/T4P/T4SS family [Endozoicomonas sp. G2_2]MBO9471091.1 Flp pilus assembly complex ATPase component TadA [Endozoicomonas sp. G2_2]